MGTVFKRKGRDGKPLRNYSISFFDHTGRRRTESARTSCKRTADQILREREDRVTGILKGTVDLDAEHFKGRARDTIQEARVAYLAQFRSKAKCRGQGSRSARTVQDEKTHLDLFFDHKRAGGIRSLGDLSGYEFLKAVDAVTRAMADDGRSGYTTNQRMRAVRRFLTWCVQERLLQKNPLERWKAMATEPIRRRRPLKDDEVERLLEVAREHGREMWYLLGVRTGLRRSEMRRLTWGDVDLKKAVVRLSADKTKGRREAVLPLTSDLRALMASEKPALVHPSAVVFRTAPTNLIRRSDFEQAGIPLIDDEGRHADMHSLRGTMSCTLAKKGVAPQLHQKLMRHSDFRLTMAVYTHLELADLAEAIKALEPEPEKAKKAE